MTLDGEFGGRSFLLASAAIGLSAGMTATLFYSLGTFIPSLEAEFGWSRGDISLAVTLMTLAVFVSGSAAGRLCDRYGAAIIAQTATACVGRIETGEKHQQRRRIAEMVHVLGRADSTEFRRLRRRRRR